LPARMETTRVTGPLRRIPVDSPRPAEPTLRFASVDMGIYGHLTRRNLAVLAAERGDAQEEERLWRAVLAECPRDREALARLANGREGTPVR
jgi:hypothetical protein